MSNDPFGSLLGGNSNNMLLSLLPMLLGGKGGNMDITTLLSLLDSSRNAKGVQGTGKGEAANDFPPLFAEEGTTSSTSDFSALAPLLSNLTKRDRGESTVSSTRKETSSDVYPYELQYNRPKKEH